MLKKLYEILSTLHYNSERGEFLEEVLAKFLAERDSQLDIVSAVRQLGDKKMAGIKERQQEIQKGEYSKSEYLKTEWFTQETMLLSNLSQKFVPEYILGKFTPYAEEFKEHYTFDHNLLWLFAFKFAEYIEFKKMSAGFNEEIYMFKNKQEYADFGFVELPPTIYTEHWKNVITINKKEIQRIFFGVLSSGDLEKVLEILSIRFDNLPNDPKKLHFSLTPFLQTEDDIILMTPSYLCRSLPLIYEILFKKCKSYLNSKGNSFEKIVQSAFKTTPTQMLCFNIKYGEKNQFEADAVIAFKQSLWIIEASSHLPSMESLKGDLFHVRCDLNKTVKKCLIQGTRAIQKLNLMSLPSPYKDLNCKGIIIVVDGVYPNLNIEPFIELSLSGNVPTYVINYFDLMTLLDQPEWENFEDFLLWRTQRPMPILCLDEKDYWNYYFDRYKVFSDQRDAFKTLQQKQSNLFYIGYRFNRKDYLGRMPREKPYK